MAMQFTKPNMINFGVDASQIAQQASLAKGVDFTPAFDAMINITNEKLQSKKRMAIMKNSNEIGSILDNANSVFSDRNLFKDPGKLEQEKESLNKTFSTAYDNLMNINMSEEERETLYSKYDKMKKHMDDKIAAQEKLESFNKQQEEININISEASNRVMSAAYSGNVDYMDNDFKLIEESIEGQVEKGLLARDKATNFLGNISANATIIASSKTDISKIINSDLTDTEKVKELKMLKNKYSDDGFIKSLSNELSKDSSLSKATAEMHLRDNIGKVEKLANMEINHISNDFKSTSMNFKSMSSNLSKMTVKQQDKFKNLMQSGEKYEAYSFYAETTGEIFEFKTRDDFYNNKEIQQTVYGKTFDVKDINDNTVPTNVLPSQAVENIKSIATDPLGQLNLSQDDYSSLSQFDLQSLMYKKAIDTVKYYMDTDDNVSAMKYLTGQNIEPIQLMQNGSLVTIDLNDMATSKALIDESTPDSRVKRLANENIVNGNIPRVIGSIQNYQSIPENKIEKRETLRVQMGNAGIALPKNVLDNEDKPLIKPKNFYSKGTLTPFLTDNLQSILEDMQPDLSQEEIVQAYNDVKQILTSSESEIEELTNYAITVYNSQGYVEANDIQEGITRKSLFNKKINGVTAIDKAVDLWIRKKYQYDTIGSESYQPIK